jgi:protein-S-isoprenylcysteine O-methyltransferase Ste14
MLTHFHALAPWDPPKKLVVIGLYRFVRNPMYIGVLLLVLGWGLYFCSPILFLYTATLSLGFHMRVITNEEPWLKAQFGIEWDLYQKEVARWLPRIKPWKESY